MRSCGQCSAQMVICVTRRKEHMRFECPEALSAWNAAVESEGELTQKKKIKAAKSKFQVSSFKLKTIVHTFEICVSCRDNFQPRYCVTNITEHKKRHAKGLYKHPKTGEVIPAAQFVKP